MIASMPWSSRHEVIADYYCVFLNLKCYDWDGSICWGVPMDVLRARVWWDVTVADPIDLYTCGKIFHNTFRHVHDVWKGICTFPPALLIDNGY